MSDAQVGSRAAMDDRTGDDNDFLDYVRVLWRRKWLIAGAVAAAVATSQYIAQQQTPIYSAKSRIMLAVSDAAVYSTDGNAVVDPLQVETSVQLLESSKIRQAVRRQLGSASTGLRDASARPIAGTRVIVITTRATSPEVAASSATAYAQVFSESRRDQAIENALELSRKLEERTVVAKAQLDELEAKLARAAGQPAEQQSLRQQRDVAATNYTSLRQKVDQATTEAAVRTGGAEVLDEGAGSHRPVSPRPQQSGATAAALGLMLGCVAAIAMEYLDDSLRTADQIDRRTRSTVPVLATIPALTDWRDIDTPRLITVENPASPAAEAYRSLRTSVQLLEAAQNSPIIQISSPAASEGKTTTLANLAVAFSLANRKVTVVDCDLRRPRLNEFFGIKNEPGLTGVLAGDVPLHRALQMVDVGNGHAVRVLPAGRRAANPAELLGTARLKAILEALQAESDVVLLDAPPVLPVTDAIVLAARADCVLLVASLNQTSGRHFSRAVTAFKAAGAPLEGIVANGGPTDDLYRYNYS